MNSVFEGDGEVRRLLRDVNWDASPFGPVAGWSPVLESLVRYVLDAPTPLCLLWGPDFVQVYNDSYVPQMGNRHPGGLLQPTLECWPELKPIFGPILTRVWSGESISIEDYALNALGEPDAGPSWFTTSWTAIHEDGVVAGAVVLSIDVTDRKRAEEEHRLAERAERRSLEKEVAERTVALAAREELLEAITQAQAVSLAVLTAVRDDAGNLVDLEFLLSNDTSNAIAGGSDLQGRRLTEVFPAVRTRLLDHLLGVVETGQPLDEVFRFDVDGNEQWFRWEAVRFRDGLVLNSQIVTELVRTDRELRRVRDELEYARDLLRLELGAVLAAVPEGVALFDAEGRITYQNEASEHLFEATAVSPGVPAALWVVESALTRADGSSLPYEGSPLERALSRGDVTSDFILRVQPDAGRPRWVSLSCAPIRDERGRIAGAVLVQHDVTEQWVT